MAERKRPKGRKKYVSESDKEAKRRDDQGRGTGPVGSGRDNDGPEDDKGLADGLLGLLGDGTLPPGSSGGSSSGSSSSSGSPPFCGSLPILIWMSTGIFKPCCLARLSISCARLIRSSD